jgi:hypothetical protein
VPAAVSYPEGSDIRASYTCEAAPDARPVDCTGVLTGGGSMPNGRSLPSSRGSYRLVVTARDHRGRTRRKAVAYTIVTGGRRSEGPVTGAGPTTTETTPIQSGTTETPPTATAAPASPPPITRGTRTVPGN